ncbi:hypothetical protein R3P38DRAFT_2793635 [Favolaschia claudopus]|uniref:Uncharacterized protein n=1 Tax=Favolaschia claudopus TaxID=2862362 RepID=A0AAW0AE68_9AGAR
MNASSSSAGWMDMSPMAPGSLNMLTGTSNRSTIDLDSSQMGFPQPNSGVGRGPLKLNTNSSFTNPLQYADHEALLRSGNFTYTRLMTAHNELCIKYATLSDAYHTLANAVPQVFRYIPNPLQIQSKSPSDTSMPASLPGSSTASASSATKDDFPLIKYFSRPKSSEALSDLATDDNENSKLWFLEQRDGTPFTATKIADARKHLRRVFTTLLDQKQAPAKWSQASSVAANWMRDEMLTYCPELGFCEDNWKLDVFASEVYSQWSRHRRDAIEASHKKAAPKAKGAKKRKLKAVEDSDDDSDDPVVVKKAKSSSRTTNSSVSRPATPAASSRSSKTFISKSRNKPNPTQRAPSAESSYQTSSASVPPQLDDSEEPEIEPPNSSQPKSTPSTVPPNLLRSASPDEDMLSRPSSPVFQFSFSRSPSPSLLLPPDDDSDPSDSEGILDKTPSKSASPPVQPPSASSEDLVLEQPPPRRIRIVDPLQDLSNASGTPIVSRIHNRDPPAPVVENPAEGNDENTNDPESTVRQPVVPEPSAENSTKKKQPHRPGPSDTSWNLFARDHMKLNPKHTSAEARAVFEALDDASRSHDGLAVESLRLDLRDRNPVQKGHVTLVTITLSHISLLAVSHHLLPSLYASLPASVRHRRAVQLASSYARPPTFYAHLHRISPPNSRARSRMSILFCASSSRVSGLPDIPGETVSSALSALSGPLNLLEFVSIFQERHCRYLTCICQAGLAFPLGVCRPPALFLSHARCDLWFTSPFAVVRIGSSGFSPGGAMGRLGRPGRVLGLVGSETVQLQGTEGNRRKQSGAEIEQN